MENFLFFLLGVIFSFVFVAMKWNVGPVQWLTDKIINAWRRR